MEDVSEEFQSLHVPDIEVHNSELVIVGQTVKSIRTFLVIALCIGRVVGAGLHLLEGPGLVRYHVRERLRVIDMEKASLRLDTAGFHVAGHQVQCAEGSLEIGVGEAPSAMIIGLDPLPLQRLLAHVPLEDPKGGAALLLDLAVLSIVPEGNSIGDATSHNRCPRRVLVRQTEVEGGTQEIGEDHYPCTPVVNMMYALMIAKDEINLMPDATTVAALAIEFQPRNPEVQLLQVIRRGKGTVLSRDMLQPLGANGLILHHLYLLKNDKRRLTPLQMRRIPTAMNRRTNSRTVS
ncbi:MAG: hypothetical protein LQ342_007480 [Letrouitia transgressa]|nr:MAG: hypothetical protein LQ342_007480 [Letrouitia transgressa]